MWHSLKAFIKITIYVVLIFCGLLLFSVAAHNQSVPGRVTASLVALLGGCGIIGVFWRHRWETVTFVVSLIVLVFGGVFAFLIPKPMAQAPTHQVTLAERPAALKKIETTATSVANQAVTEYRNTPRPENKVRAVASLSSASSQLRTLQATRRAGDAVAIKETVKSASVSDSVTDKVAPAVASAVAEAVDEGVPADQANEAAARGLDKAATAPSAVDRLRDEMQSANIAFNAPGTVGYGSTATIELKLSATKTPDQLSDMIDQPGVKETASVQISSEMEARLVGDQFQITAVTKERQPVSATGLTQWTWDIAPKQLGQQELHLSLDAIVTIAGHQDTYTLQTFNRAIVVKVVWPASAISFLAKYWQWVCTAVVFPVIVWLAKRFFKG